MTTVAELFKEAGLSYEHPGYYSGNLPSNDFSFTVGIEGEGMDENPEYDTTFSIQIVNQDGTCVAEQDIHGAENVVAAYKLMTMGSV